MKNSRKKFNKKFIRKLFYLLVLPIVSAVYLVLVSGNVITEETWKNIFASQELTDIKYDSSNNSGVADDMTVHFLDVGDADCSYIRCEGVNILIDAADKEPQGEVVNYLKNRGVEKLDLVVATHPHRDHIGQMSDVLENFEVVQFIEPEIPEEANAVTVTYERMLETLANKNIRANLVTAGFSTDIGDLKIEVVGPISHDSENLNNNSVVLRITYKNVRFLFMGDAEKAEEQEILSEKYDVSADVLKVGHHGSTTSTTQKFLHTVSPKYAVISVSKDKHRTRKPYVMDRLKKYCGNDIYVTGECGNVIALTDGENIEFKKSA